MALRRATRRGEPGELARVPERLEVEEDHARVRIVLPVLQQIVAADVRLVADRDELGDADPELAGAAHQLDPQTTRLREERDRAATGSTGANVAFMRTSGAVFTMPRQFGPITRMPLRRAVATMARSASLPLGTGLGEAGGDDHDAEHLLLRALFDHARNEVGRHDDQRDVDRVGNVEDARVRAHARDRHGGRVDRIHRALEVVREQVAEQLVADRARVTARADDRDRTRRQDARRRRGFCALLACLDRRDRIVGRLDRETDADGAVLEVAVRLPPRVGEHVEHPRVVRQRVRAERRDPVRPGNDREVLEQQRPEAAALLVVLHAERDLGLVVAGAVVARDGDDIVAELGDEGHVRVVVDRGEPFEVGRRRRGHRREEPQVQRLVAEPFVQAEEPALVVGTDRADAHRAAVRQDDIALPVRGVLGHRYGTTTARPSIVPSRSRWYASAASSRLNCSTWARSFPARASARTSVSSNSDPQYVVCTDASYGTVTKLTGNVPRAMPTIVTSPPTRTEPDAMPNVASAPTKSTTSSAPLPLVAALTCDATSSSAFHASSAPTRACELESGVCGVDRDDVRGVQRAEDLHRHVAETTDPDHDRRRAGDERARETARFVRTA